MSVGVDESRTVGEGGDRDLSPTSAGPAPGFVRSARSAVRRLSVAVMLSALIVSASIYMKPSGDRYEAFHSDGRIIRIDRQLGSIIACGPQRCVLIAKGGGHATHAHP